MYWYTAPAILKHWVDEVLNYGFAYEMDENGEFQALILKDKEFQMVITMGADEKSFVGEDRLTVKECLNSYSYTAKMLGMKELEPVLTYDSANQSDLDTMASKVKESIF